MFKNTAWSNLFPTVYNYLFHNLNEHDVIFARKCHIVQKMKKNTGCFFVRKITLKFCGHKSQAAETYQTDRRQNNIAWSKLFQETKQFPENNLLN